MPFLSLRFLESEPQVVKLIKQDSNDKATFEDPKTHINKVIETLDIVISMLGPDLEDVVNDLIALGQSHAQNGMTAENLSSLGASIFYAIDKILGSKFTQNQRKSWHVFFQFIAAIVARGMENSNDMLGN